jgi:hypothetical protein
MIADIQLIDYLALATSKVNCSEYYIGLHNIGNTLQWSDGSVYNYSNWDSGKLLKLFILNNWLIYLGCPTDNINGSEQCVTINSNGKWCNRNCALRYCYICVINFSILTTTTTG